MRLPAILSGVFLCVVVIAAQNSTASAEVSQQLLPEHAVSIANELAVLEVVEQSEKSIIAPSEAPKPKEHAVVEGETLTTVAKQYDTTWQRLYSKNVELAHPDVIKTGDKVIIPLPDEQLPERALPEPPAPPVAASGQAVKRSPKPKQAAASLSRGSSSGNTYTAGYCTWYAKNRRPDLPNNLGNADTWVSRARAQGLPTGSAPRAGAIGQQGMHVVYVESVNGDGTVTISEMNYTGFGVISSRTVAASNFMYIY